MVCKNLCIKYKYKITECVNSYMGIMDCRTVDIHNRADDREAKIFLSHHQFKFNEAIY